MSHAEVKPSQPSSETGPDPRGDLLFILCAAAIFSVILTFNALNVLHERAESGHPLRIWEPVTWEASSGLFFLAVLPGMLVFTRRVWPLHAPIVRKIAWHLAAAIAISLAHVLSIGVMRWTVYRLAGDRYDAFGPLRDWPYEFRKDLISYAAWVGFYVMWRKLRARAANPTPAEEDVLEVRDGARRHFVPLAEVVWVEAAGNYVELHRGATGLLHRASLADMERRLEGVGFVRIHRSRLVRKDAVAAVESKPTGDFLVRLRDGRELTGSRRYRRPLLAD